MNVTFETVICAWDEKIPALLIRLVNTLLFCRTEEELRISKGSVQFIQSRLFIATF